MKRTLRSNAKINIGLNIIKKREDGYHELEMIMAPIDLYDILEVEENLNTNDLEITSETVGIPNDKNNIIYKIYNSFFEYTKKEKIGFKVKLVKNIPFSAGLGGGSGNGAVFLLFLNEYFGNVLNYEEMIFIGKKVGADIPFFIINKTAFVEGIGEKITVIENKLESNIILIKPEFGINTKEAYESFAKTKQIKKADLIEIKQGLRENNIIKVTENIENALQQSLKENKTEILNFEEKLKLTFNSNYYMSGSGSCYYILTEKDKSEENLKKAEESFKGCFISLHKFI